jgi:membrane-bound lytic murein transglycosylase A
MLRILSALLLSLALVSCDGSHGPSEETNKLLLEQRTFKQMPSWDEDNHVESLTTFLKSCTAFGAMNETAATGQGALMAPAYVWQSTCRKAQTVPPGDDGAAKKFFEDAFIPMRATNNGKSTGLITGYYAPLLKGSLVQQHPFTYPVYGLPETGTPSYTRSQIDLGILNGHAPVLAYVDDPVQLFFLHVQGSGSILLDNGSTINVAYAGTNGRPYVSIGKSLVDKGYLQKGKVTLPVLKRWLYDHPADMWQVLWTNTSYVFFRVAKGAPTGTEQVPLTGGRSAAVDPAFIPLGMPIYVDSVFPDASDAPVTIHRKLLIAQDTGHAIKGPLRCDIFFGAGDAAEQLAGRLKAGGEITLLVPRALAVTLTSSK